LRLIDSTRPNRSEVSAIFMMDKKVLLRVWNLVLPEMILLLPLIETIVRLLPVVIHLIELLPRWCKREQVPVEVKVDPCITITPRPISMEVMVSLVLKFQ